MKPFPAMLAALLCGAAVAPTSALTINLNYDTNGQANSIPAGDLTGSRLMAIAQAAADYWEDIIEDAHVLNITVRYDNGIGQGFIGLWTQTAEGGGRPISGVIGVRGTTNWYYDTSPTNHSEYQMQQTLFRNAGGDAANFSGNVPGALEIIYNGNVDPGASAQAQNGTDLLTLMLHEIGHAVGMSSQLSTCNAEIADNDFDINSNLVNGNVMQVLTGGNTGAHVACTMCLMNPTIGTGRRALPSACDVLAVATGPNPGWTQIDLPRQDFLPGGTLDWNTPSNWVGNQLPGTDDSAFVRYGLDVGANPLITLSGLASARNLTVANATSLRTFANKLDIVSTTTVEYDGNAPYPQIYVESGGELETTDAVVNGGAITMSGGLLDIGDDLIISDTVVDRQGTLQGYGSIDLDGTLVNNGRISPTAGNTLTFNSPSFTPWDLDGSGGQGEVIALQGNVNFASGGMADNFDGYIQIADPYTVTLADAWVLGSGGLIDLDGGAPDFATLAGGLMVANDGGIQASGNSRITGPIQWGGTLELVVGAGGLLDLQGLATVSGGAYLLGQGGILGFSGTTVISDGTFLIPDNAEVTLSGTHTLEGGTFSGNGSLRFTGDQTIIGAPVTIGCDNLDFDGGGGALKVVNVNADLTIHSDLLDFGNSVFNSILNINNSATVDVTTATSWEMAGDLNIDSNSTSYLPSIAGQPFTMSGDTVVDDSTRWDAVSTITGIVTLPTAADRLQLNGGDLQNPNLLQGGLITGGGSLRASGRSLVGNGQIVAKIDFVSGASLLADDGTLLLSASDFLSVPPVIGTADTDGILDVTNSWTLPSGSVLSMAGGIVQGGGSINNQGAVNGFGELRGNNVINNSSISADGGPLVINTVAAPDLDGQGTVQDVQGHTVNAINGDIYVIQSPSDALGCGVNVGPGRTMGFQAGWTLDTAGTLAMLGNTQASPATLSGGHSTLLGSLLVDDFTRITGTSQFESSSTVQLTDLGTVLQLEANSSIAAGATFTGSGQLVVEAASILTLADGATVAAHLVSSDGRIELGASPGQVTVTDFSQQANGTLAIELFDKPNTTDWDQLTVTGSAQLGGRLDVSFNVAGVVTCDTWKVIDAGSVSGDFDQFTVSGLPAGYTLLKVVAPDGVYLKLAELLPFATWAAAQGLPPGLDGPQDDPDGDHLPNGLEMFLGSNPNAADFDKVPQAAVIDANGDDYLSIRLDFGGDAVPSDVSVFCRRSVDLVNWSAASVVETSSGYDPVKCVESRVYRSAIPYGTLTREFLRIEVKSE